MVIEKPMPSGIYVAENKHQQDFRRISQISYPKAIYFILATEFCERFTYYGIRNLIPPFMKDHLEIKPSIVKVVNQVFLMFSYCFPLLGAIMADAWLNKYRTIIYMIPVYAAGTYLVIIAALPNVPGMILAMTGLVVAYLGLGGVRPCIIAFGGDQFILPQQESYLKKYFSVFYFTINAGSFLAELVIPSLSERNCFGRETCYFAAYWIIAIALTFGGIVLISGRKFYYISNPDCNVVAKMIKCICYALRKREKVQGHWLDKASDKYDTAFINDVKTVLRILVLYIPLPFFRALFDQHGLRWQIQAARMTGDIGKLKLEAEQMRAANSIFILLFIPLFEAFLYPTFARYNFLKQPLQRLTAGGLISALAFVVSAMVEMQLEPTDEYLPRPDEAQIRLYNGLAEPLSIEFLNPYYGEHVIPSLGLWSKVDIPAKGQTSLQVAYPMNGTMQIEKFKISENAMTSYLVTKYKIIEIPNDEVEKSKEGAPKVMTIFIQPTNSVEIVTIYCENRQKFTVMRDKPFTPYVETLDCDSYQLEKNGEIIFKSVEMEQGGVYVVFLLDKGDKTGIKSNMLTVVKPNTVHMLWLVPQYLLITIGEVMFSITGFEFSFTQAPVSMKALMQAAWLLTAALGKVIVLSAGTTKLFDRLFSEFMLFAALMTFDMFVFAALAVRYKYVVTKEEEAGTSHIK